MSPKTPLYKPSKLELVEVAWADALYDGEFDGQPEAFDGKLAVLLNVGYFVKMTRESVVLASCQQPSNGTVRWFVTIPRVQVKEIRSFQPRRVDAEEAK